MSRTLTEVGPTLRMTLFRDEAAVIACTGRESRDARRSESLPVRVRNNFKAGLLPFPKSMCPAGSSWPSSN